MEAENVINLQIQEYDGAPEKSDDRDDNMTRKFKLRLTDESGKSKCLTFESARRIDSLLKDMRNVTKKAPQEPEAVEPETQAKFSQEEMEKVTQRIATLERQLAGKVPPQEKPPSWRTASDMLPAGSLPRIPRAPPRLPPEEEKGEPDSDYLEIDITAYADDILKSLEENGEQNAHAISHIVWSLPNGKNFDIIDIERFLHYLVRRKYLIFDGVTFRLRGRRSFL